MRRIGLLAAAAAAVAVGIVQLAGCGAGGASLSGPVRVDVIFDNSRGLVPGQLLEVAGGRAGTIHSVSVTPDFKARIALEVDRRFTPFHRDASCTIRAQGLLAENYVQCDPGTAAAPEVRSRAGQAPTVPVARTTQPVSLSDLFNIWSVPTTQRLRVLITALGIGSGARGGDLNAILRRANPALGRARRLITILQQQRTDLLAAVDATGGVVRDLAQAPGATPALIRRSARVLARTQAHRADLGRTVAKLPALLQQAQPALAALDAVTAAGTPVLRELHRAAPDLGALSAGIGPLARAAAPTLAALGPVLRRGAGTVRRAAPVTKLLQQYAGQSLPSARLTGTLLTDLRDKDFITNLLGFFYNAASATARFDATSHLIPAHISISACSGYAASPVAGCGARPVGARRTQTATTPRRPAAVPAPRAPRPEATPAPSAAAPPAASPAPSAPPATTLPAPGTAVPDAVRGLLDWLLK